MIIQNEAIDEQQLIRLISHKHGKRTKSSQDMVPARRTFTVYKLFLRISEQTRALQTNPDIISMFAILIGGKGWLRRCPGHATRHMKYYTLIFFLSLVDWPPRFLPPLHFENYFCFSPGFDYIGSWWKMCASRFDISPGHPFAFVCVCVRWRLTTATVVIKTLCKEIA